MLNENFSKIFGELPILGMIHLAGDGPTDKVDRALEELAIFEKEGVDGAIIENYHGRVDDVERTLKEIDKANTKVVMGINILSNEFDLAFRLAKKYGAKFIQLDYIAGKYTSGELPVSSYMRYKQEHPDVVVLGGVWPKYYHPVNGSNLEADLIEGMKRAEAIVVTGKGTGKETPFDKIKSFRKSIGKHPLIVGAGLNPENAYEQLSIADGAIVGSSLKIGYETENAVDKDQVRDLMKVVRKVRAEHSYVRNLFNY